MIGHRNRYTVQGRVLAKHNLRMSRAYLTYICVVVADTSPRILSIHWLEWKAAGVGIWQAFLEVGASYTENDLNHRTAASSHVGLDLTLFNLGEFSPFSVK
jgi:hypothetical protein